MSTRVDPISTIIASFPIPELTKIDTEHAKPSYITLLRLQRDLNTNAASIETTQGTGLHGFLVLTMKPIDFLLMTADIAHAAPPNPGPMPVAATAAQAREHEHSTYQYKLYHSTDLSLKKILIAAVDELYLRAIQHPQQGFANVTTLTILTHLWATYGEIIDKDLDNNLSTMATPWQPTSPIETLFQQIDDGIAFALAGGSPIDDPTAVRILYKIIFNTGVFELACREWRARNIAQRTLALFKPFLIAANKDRAATTASVGYHANASTTSETQIATLIDKCNKLQKQVNQLQAARPNNTTTSTTAGAPAAIDNRAPPKHKGYCHTHGHTLSHNPNKLHTSATCLKPGPDHKTTATATNTMGGNERVWQPATKPTANATTETTTTTN